MRKRWFRTLMLMGGVAIMGLSLLVSRYSLLAADKDTGSGVTARVYTSPLAGRWYDADAETLKGRLKAYLERATPEAVSPVRALIMPHAGYEYSGSTAAFAAKLLEGKTYSRIVVLGPTHRVPMENVASVPDYTSYKTPLGEVPLDTAFMAALKKYPYFKTIPSAHDGEHSVQIELPFLQMVTSGFTFVPIVVGHLDEDAARAMGKILLSLVDASTLVVFSTDFTHYGARFDYTPFKDDIPAQLEKLDMGAFDLIKKKDFDGFYKYCDDTGITICGRYGLAVLLAMLGDDAQVQLLKYANSSQTTGDYSSCVSYVAAAVSGEWKKGEAVPAAAASASEAEFTLTEAEKDGLLKLARATIGYALRERHYPSQEETFGVEITPAMKETRAAFVTLNENDALRGCIGDIYPSRPLYKSVMTNAYNAAFQDPRFNEVRQDEFDKIEIEISVLTPPRPIASYEDIVVGKHGVFLSKNGRRAVFLPNVAPEQGWDRDTMLMYLSKKAGLPGDAWKEGASFEVFESLLFEEKK